MYSARGTYDGVQFSSVSEIVTIFFNRVRNNSSNFTNIFEPRDPPRMKKERLLLLPWMMVAAGCGGGSSSMPASSAVLVSITPQAAAIGSGQTTQFTATTGGTGGVTWKASVGVIDANGNYTAPTGTRSVTATITATSSADATKSGSAKVNVVVPGVVAPTSNAQVAAYTIAPAAAGNVSVQFGLDTNYGLTTSTQPVPQGGGALSLFVAGMKANTLYHMRGVVQFGDNSQFMDADQTFTTGTTTHDRRLTPQSGVELLDMIGSAAPVAVSDLNGKFCGVTTRALQA
jgi:hypothetical protein